MAQYEKGIETKRLLLQASRELFYRQGYEQTTTRQIAEKSGTNLGLIKYYFESKADIALLIYLEIRNAFSGWLQQFGYTVPQMYLIDSALELRLCFNSPPFGRFYDQIYKEPKLRALFQSKVLDSLHMSSRVNAMGAGYFTFACLSISAIKPALVSFYLNPGGEKYSPDSYIRYYMAQQIHYLQYENPQELLEFCLQELTKYYFDAADNFAPVMSRLVP